MVQTTPIIKNITGSDLSGSDGTADRTYTIPGSTLFLVTVITINGTNLHEGSSNDFTISGQVITFKNIIDDTDIIRLEYFNITGSTLPGTGSDLKYATTVQLADVLGIKLCVPTWSVGSSPTKEEVGVGDDSTTIFYLDHKNILTDTYTLYYGVSGLAATALTETTHYVVDKDDGKITLTSAGVTLVTTNNIYAEYCYTDMFNDSYLTQVLLRAEQEVDNNINSTFTDGTTTNPNYPSKVEIQPTLGNIRNEYFSEERPLIDVNSLLASDITATDNTLDVTAGDGSNFPSSGTIIIGTEKITYSGVTTDTLTGLSRGVGDSTAAVHTSTDEIHTTIIEISGTTQGTSPTWYVQEWKSKTYVDETGKVFIYDTVLTGTTLSTNNVILPRMDVENRLRITYLYGYDTIPVDITRLTIIFAKRQLIQDNIGKAMIQGRNEFNPEMFNADTKEMDRIIGFYQVLGMGNT